MSLQDGQPDWHVSTSPGPGVEVEVNCTAISHDGSTLLAGTSVWNQSGVFDFTLWDRRGSDVTRLWTKPWNGGRTSFQGVYWVALSASGEVAGIGGFTDHGAGLVELFDRNGTQLLSFPTGGVEELMIDDSGRVAAWVAGDQGFGVAIAEDDGFAAFTVDVGDYCRSLALSADGRTVIVGGEKEIYRYRIAPGAQPIPTGTFPIPSHSLKVAITPSGRNFGALLSDGDHLFFRNSGEGISPMWTDNTANHGCPPSRTGYAMTMRDDPASDCVIVVSGTNLPQEHWDAETAYGWVNHWTARPTSDVHTLDWQCRLERCPNPGLVITGDCSRIGACDGQPYLGGSTKETDGNFYYIDALTGTELWSRRTRLMNWGLDITPAGDAMFGGSDTGELFLWVAPTGAA